MSQFIERIHLTQLLDHLNAKKFWSAYRAELGTEAALLRVLNDLLIASDNNKSQFSLF